MKWIHHYQLFLFDFDGLLVNTEWIHYQAYIAMCAQRGFSLKWDFHRYSEAAHHNATDLRDQIYAEFPALHAQEPHWSTLYTEKKHAFIQLVKQGAAQLMPGVALLLQALQKANIQRGVVTHSATSVIQDIRQQNPILDTIPHWITREDYTHPKPHPECYQIAIDRLATANDAIIGFEDSPRGLHALAATRAQPVLICPADSVYLPKLRQLNVPYYPTFTDIHEDNFPKLNGRLDK